MDTLKTRFIPSMLTKRHTIVPQPLTKPLSSEITKIEFNKKRRRESDDDYEMALTNDQTTIFETKTRREARKTFNPTGLRESTTKAEASSNINMRIRKQYKEKLEDIENTGKTIRALAMICPKVDGLIDADETNTNLENKLYSSEFHTRRSPGYVCSPQLSILGAHPIPDKIQDRLYRDLQDEENPPI